MALPIAVLTAACATEPVSETTLQATIVSAAPAGDRIGTTPGSAVGDTTPPPTASGRSAAPPVTDDRPYRLGTRVLPTTPDGAVVPQTTPEALIDRRLPTIDILAPPRAERFRAEIVEVPEAVLVRSTWTEGCPVGPEDLRYVTMTFWGFDGRAHTGEMMVNRSVANDIVDVFGTLYDERFPIEEMRVVSRADLDAEPTGDGNNTTSFVCRPVTGGSRFSEHALGLAIDVNPFHNPYQRRSLVLPELSTAYLDRSHTKPGMIADGDVVTRAFAAIGWHWGGHWRSLKDYQHFSLNDR